MIDKRVDGDSPAKLDCDPKNAKGNADNDQPLTGLERSREMQRRANEEYQRRLEERSREELS